MSDQYREVEHGDHGVAGVSYSDDDPRWHPVTNVGGRQQLRQRVDTPDLIDATADKSAFSLDNQHLALRRQNVTHTEGYAQIEHGKERAAQVEQAYHVLGGAGKSGSGTVRNDLPNVG